MRRLQFFLVVVSLLVLGAHFLREGLVLLVGAVLVLVALTTVRRPWAARTLQGALVLGALEWLRTMIGIAHERMRAGEPWGRMAAILGLVLAVTALSATLLNSRTMRAWFGMAGGRAAPDADRPAGRRIRENR